MRRASSLTAAAVALFCAGGAAAAGCATATGDVTGGEARFDASAPLTFVAVDAGPLGTGHTWQELYTDYFGNPGRAACAGNGSCHGTANEPGSQTSAFVCPLNDKDTCYTSIVSGAAQLVVVNDPGNSALVTQVLRHADGSSGNMPKSPPYAFTATDLQRISDWIQNGAPNDVDEVDAGNPDTDSGSGDADIGDAAGD